MPSTSLIVATRDDAGNVIKFVDEGGKEVSLPNMLADIGYPKGNAIPSAPYFVRVNEGTTLTLTVANGSTGAKVERVTKDGATLATTVLPVGVAALPALSGITYYMVSCTTGSIDVKVGNAVLGAALASVDPGGVYTGLSINGGPVTHYATSASYDVAAIGDSITDQNNNSSIFNLNSIGYMTWLGILSDQKINFDVGLNFGVSGNTSADILARIPGVITAMIARNCRRAVCHWNTNDVNGGIALETSMSNTQKIYKALSDAGIEFVVVPVLPRSFNSSVTMRKVIPAFNNALRELVRKTPGARWADPSVAFADNVTDTNAFPLDGTVTPAASVTARFSGTTMTVEATSYGELAQGQSVALTGAARTSFPQVLISSLGTYTAGTGTGTVTIDTNVGTVGSAAGVLASNVANTTDKLHPSPSGAFTIASAILAVVPDWCYYPSREFVAATDIYDATYNPTGSVFNNPTMAGSVALAGTDGMTGVMATSFTLTKGIGSGDATVTAVCSKVNITLPNGNVVPAQQLVLTAPAGKKGGWTLSAAKNIPWVVGNKITTLARVAVSNITPGSFVGLFLRTRDGASGTAIGNVSPTPGRWYQPNAAWSGKIRAPDYTCTVIGGAGNLGCDLIFTIDGTVNPAGATMTLVISQFGGIFVP